MQEIWKAIEDQYKSIKGSFPPNNLVSFLTCIRLKWRIIILLHSMRIITIGNQSLLPLAICGGEQTVPAPQKLLRLG